MRARDPSSIRQRPARMVATWVTTAPPGDHTDPATPGLQLRVRPHARGVSRAWCFRYRWRGQPVRIVFGHVPAMTLADARTEAQRMRKALDEGIDPRRARPRRRPTPTALPVSAAVASPDARFTIEHLATEFLERHVRPHRKRPEYVERILARDVLTPWKGRDARTIEPGEVLDLLDGIVARGSRVMANRVAAVLSQLFRFGVHRRIVTTSPVQLLYSPGGSEKPRDRALSDRELGALLRNVDAVMARAPRTALALRVLLLTGARRGELALARWTEIDLASDAPLWRVPPENAKTGVEYLTPLAPAAVDALEKLKRHAGASRWVLPNEAGDGPADPKLLTRSVARHAKALVKVGVAAFTLHDLRRTARTGLARLKIAPHIAERVLNHAQPSIAATYDTHTYLDEKRDALTAWAAHLERLEASDPDAH